MYKLIAMDVDGTLVGSSGVIYPNVCIAVENARRAGILITLISGRNRTSLRPLVAQLGISAPYAGTNGAFIADPAQDEPIAQFPIREQDARQIVALADRERASGVCFQQTDWTYLDEGGYKWMSREVPRVILHATALSPVDLLNQVPRPNKIDLMGEERILQSILAAIQLERLPVVVVPGMNPRYLELTAAGVTKGEVLERICAVLNIPVHTAVAIGDGANDVSMFAKAGLSFAMGNACREVQAAATQVAPSLGEDGVAWVIETVIQTNLFG